MIVVLDTKCLIRWAKADGHGSLDRARLDHLLSSIAAARGRVILPAPVVAEFLVKSDVGTVDWLTALERKSSIVVAPFDRRAALECALLDRAALASGDKKGGREDPWQRIKVDRQITAIARVVGATSMVTDDVGLAVTARTVGIQVRGLSDLDLPDSARQEKLDLHPRTEDSQDSTDLRLPASMPPVDVPTFAFVARPGTTNEASAQQPTDKGTQSAE